MGGGKESLGGRAAVPPAPPPIYATGYTFENIHGIWNIVVHIFGMRGARGYRYPSCIDSWDSGVAKGPWAPPPQMESQGAKLSFGPFIWGIYDLFLQIYKIHYYLFYTWLLGRETLT